MSKNLEKNKTFIRVWYKYIGIFNVIAILFLIIFFEQGGVGGANSICTVGGLISALEDINHHMT